MGAEADIFYLEPEPNKKISGAGAKKKWLSSAILLSIIHKKADFKIVRILIQVLDFTILKAIA